MNQAHFLSFNEWRHSDQLSSSVATWDLIQKTAAHAPLTYPAIQKFLPYFKLDFLVNQSDATRSSTLSSSDLSLGPLATIHALHCEIWQAPNTQVTAHGYGFLETSQGYQIHGFFIEDFDFEASAGSGSYTNDYVNISRAFVSEYEYSHYLGHENPTQLKVLRIIGDSMERLLKSGQSCMVRLVNTFEQGGIYVFTYDGVTYIKRLTRCQDHYIASSINTKYDPFTIQEERLIIHAKLILSLEYQAQ